VRDYGDRGHGEAYGSQGASEDGRTDGNCVEREAAMVRKGEEWSMDGEQKLRRPDPVDEEPRSARGRWRERYGFVRPL